MSSIDTNVLLRYLISEDDPAQHKIAKQFVEENPTNKPIYVSLVVMVELLWLLERSFKIDRPACETLLTQLLSSPLFRFDKIVRDALVWYMEGYDFTDAVIACDAKQHGAQPVATFDKKAAKMSLFELIG